MLGCDHSCKQMHYQLISQAKRFPHVTFQPSLICSRNTSWLRPELSSLVTAASLVGGGRLTGFIRFVSYVCVLGVSATVRQSSVSRSPCGFVPVCWKQNVSLHTLIWHTLWRAWPFHLSWQLLYTAGKLTTFRTQPRDAMHCFLFLHQIHYFPSTTYLPLPAHSTTIDGAKCFTHSDYGIHTLASHGRMTTPHSNHLSWACSHRLCRWHGCSAYCKKGPPIKFL